MEREHLIYKVRRYFESRMTQGRAEKMWRFYLRFCAPIISWIYSSNLRMLAVLHFTDKLSKHDYIRHYSGYFRHLRKKKLNILEIGVGGYADPDRGGNSLRMWKYYFPNSMIYSIDICDKAKFQEERIRIFQGSQADESFLKDICIRIGSLDIIIDDGSHVNSHVITSFKALFPFLKDGGIYVIEDTQTSYWPSEGGNSENLNDPATSMNFFKSLTDGLNYREFLRPGYLPSYFDKNLTAVHFYHNLIFIFKGQNNDSSNMVVDGKLDQKGAAGGS